jgi:uncharacterized protein
LLFLVVFSAISLAQPAYPPLSGRINDGANLIAPEARQRIEAKLKAHGDKTTDQFVVATVPTLQGVSVEDFANGLFRFWKLGDGAKNNGVLLLVAPTERKVRIEVGYGLEGALTDALSKVIITTAIAPKFKTGDFAGGVEAGVDAILAILTGDAEEWQRRAVVRDDAMSTADILLVLLFVAIFLTILIAAFRGQKAGARQHRTRDGRWITLPASTSSGWSTGSSGGGWSSGSSSGGFSGGGGSSGGGGASGDW